MYDMCNIIDLGGLLCYHNQVKRQCLVSTNKATTLEEFKLFYEELTFSSTNVNRIRRLRPVVAK